MAPEIARREALGQVYTPAPVADLAIALALENSGAGARVLDPACGDGVFLARAAARGARAFGVEIDPRAASTARSHTTADVEVADFLTLPPPRDLFDAVIGNPPYVRQEVVGAAKGRIAARVAGDWPDGPAVVWSGRADLAAAFVARALRFVRPGGRVAFVVSAALLEAGYHDVLRRFLAGRGRIAAVVASPRERWFHDAAVHGVLLVLERVGERDPTPRPTVCARLRVPVVEAARRVGGLADLAAVAEVRLAARGVPLAPLLRAPDAWLRAAAEVPLVPLGALAEVRRGVTSGANSFFYLTRAAAARAGLEPAVLRPLLRSPRAAPRIAVTAAQLPVVAFVASELSPAARTYVAAHGALASRPTLAAREPWWALPATPARLFLTKAYHGRYVQPLADAPVVPDQRFYAVEPRRGVPLELLAAVLNGTLTALALEALGRASLGEGALEVSVGDAARLPVLDPRGLDARAVLAAFAPLALRPTRDAAVEADAPDRGALDAALARAVPPLRPLVPLLGPALAAASEERRARAHGRIVS